MMALACLLAAGIASGVAKADEPQVCLNENGSFEVGPNPGGFTVYSAGQAFIPNWKVTSASIDHIGTYFTCSDGNNCIDMDGTPGYGVIETTALTNPGQAYSLTFDLSGNHQGPPAVKRIVVEVAGQSSSYLDTPGQWTSHSLSFTASSA
ncbi:MAG: DUF642 domain-containing protein, partial [Sphingomonadales bacterium]